MKPRIQPTITLVHMDDESGGERKGMGGASHEVSIEFQSMVGFHFKDKKAVPEKQATYQAVQEAQVLGLVTQLAIEKEALKKGPSARVFLPKERQEIYFKNLEILLQEARVQSGLAKKCVGQLEYIRCGVWRNEGRFYLPPLLPKRQCVSTTQRGCALKHYSNS